MTQQATSVPHITMDGTAYSIEGLPERTKLLLSDMVRTVQEYNALLANYRQSLTLTTSYTNSLKEEVEKAKLPIDLSKDKEKPTITIDDNRYDASKAPDLVKQYINDLANSNKQKNNLEFRLRQLDAAKGAYHSAIKQDIDSSEVAPMDPPPKPDTDNGS